MDAAYNFEDFRIACEQETNVSVWKCAVDDARQYFNLRKQSEILRFIASGGLENRKHINTKPLEMNVPLPKPEVDAYEFYSNDKRGYFAFFFQPRTNVWAIKSFKLHDQGDDRFFPFANLESIVGKVEKK